MRQVCCLLPTTDDQQIEEVLKPQMGRECLQSCFADVQSRFHDSICKVQMVLEANHAIAVENQWLRDAIIGWQCHDAAHASYDDKDLHMDMMPSSSLEFVATATKQSFLMSDTGELPLLASEIGSREIASGTANHEEPISRQQPPQQTNPKPKRMLPPGVTTIVVRNVPARISQEQLLKLWPPDGTYDLMYLPYSVQRQHRSGLVFINMTSHEAALNFAAKWHGHKIASVRGVKRLDIGVAEVQGFIGNLKHLKRSKIARMHNEQFLPVAFEGKQKLDFRSLLAGLETPATSQVCSWQIDRLPM